MIDHGTRDHARLSPSGAVRWMTCPRSYWWEEEFPDRSSPFAEEGTAAHELAETCLRDDGLLHDYLGQWFNGFEVSDNMANAVAVYVDAIRAEPGQRWLEVRLHHPWVNGIYGTADAIIMDEDQRRLIVADYKHGQGVEVSAERNPQLMIYGLMAYLWLDLLYDIDTIEMRIYQPRLDNISVWSVEPQTLLNWHHRELTPAIVRLDHESGLMVPSEKGCRFCKAAAVCPELARQNLAAAEAVFDDAPPLPVEITEPQLPAPEQLTREQIAAIIGHSNRISSWLKSIEAHAIHALESGDELPGYKLVRGRSNRVWDDEKKAMCEALRIGMRVLEDPTSVQGRIFTPAKFKSPAQIEKILGRKAFAALEPLTRKPEGRVNIAPESDKRPAVIPDNGEHYFA